MLYLHTLTFPEVEAAKSSVVDIQGHLWAGPDRRGSNAPSRDALFLHWQKQVVMASRTSLDEIPAAVHEYFQKTKMLARAPRGDETIEMVSAPDGGYAAPAPVKRKHPNPPRFATSYSGMKDFLNCPLKWSAAKYWKTLPYIEGPEAAWGNRVHKALENVLRNIIISDDVKLIKEQGYEKYLKAILQAKKAGARVEAEQELCFTKDLKPCGWKSWDTVWFRFKGDVLVYNGPKVNYIDWKGLALDTPLPTPAGWTTMGEVSEGDALYGADGKVCRVVGKSRVKQIPCFKVSFCDGSEVVCDEEHLWSVVPLGAARGTSEVISAVDLHVKLSEGFKCAVPLSHPLEAADTALPIPPYTLGCWLGDGKHSDGSICKGDQGIFDEIAAEGFSVGGPHGTGEGEPRAPSRTVYGLRTLLRTSGVLKNKHIPRAYFRASVAQRTALVQGLMDTDGHWNHTRNQVVFTTVSCEFAHSVYELLCTLGQRPKIHTVTKRGFGRVLTGYDITFSPVQGLEPFRTPVKRGKRAATDTSKHPRTHRIIKSVEPVESVPTQCIAVDSADHLYLCGKAMIPTHNTGKRYSKRGDDQADTFQLEVAWAVVALHHPEIEEFSGSLIYLQEEDLTRAVVKRTYTRDDLPGIWEKIFSITRRMEEAWETENFRAQSSGLCRKHCGHTACPHCGG